MSPWLGGLGGQDSEQRVEPTIDLGVGRWIESLGKVGGPLQLPGQELGGALLGEDFRSPVETDVPTLFLSGTLDSNTPPFQAEEVRKRFANSWHIVIENAGHEDFWRTPAAVEEIVAFVRTGKSGDKTIKNPVPNFRRVKRRL